MDESPNATNLSDNELDFQTPIEVNTRKRKYQKDRVEESSEEEDDAIVITCSICQTYWTNSGKHSIVHLKCGHTFGRSCIDNYVKEMNSLCSYAACPKCRHLITKSDIRRIWPNKLIPENEEELKSLKQEIQDAKTFLNELSQQQITLKNEITRYKQELESLNPAEELIELIKQSQSEPGTVYSQQSSSQSNFKLQCKIHFPNEMYNVVDLNPVMDMAVVSTYNHASHKSGLRKVNILDPQITEFVTIDHKGIIRDIKHSTKDSFVLSTGDDMKVKLTSMKNNLVIQSYQLQQAAKACAFDENDTKILYCGLSSGELIIFDIRNTRSYLNKLSKPTNALPILSIVSHLDSIICTDRKGTYSWFLNEEQEYEFSPLSMEAASLDTVFSTDFKNGQFLTSTHHSGSETTKKYFVSHLEKTDINEYEEVNENYTMQLDWSFVGTNSKKSASNRNCLFQRDDQTYVCYYESNQIKIRDHINERQVISTSDDIIDIQHTSIDDMEIMAASSKSSILLYKYA